MDHRRVSFSTVALVFLAGSCTVHEWRSCEAFCQMPNHSLTTAGQSTLAGSMSSTAAARSRTFSLPMRQGKSNDSSEGFPSSVFFYQDSDRSSIDQIMGGSKSSSNNLNAFPFESSSSSSSSFNEYDRDAEFYRRRNEEYYNSLQNLQSQESYSFNELTATSTTASTEDSGHSSHHQRQQQHRTHPQAQKIAEDTINSVLQSSRTSFKNVETMTFRLLNQQPMVALGIFLAAGALVAYATGFFILEGYIENLNPIENDPVPYWNEPEIHTIMRKP